MAETTRRAASLRTRWAPAAGALIAIVGLAAIGKRLLSRIPNPLAGGMAKYYAFRVAAAVVPRLPAKLAYGAAALAGTLFWMMAPKLRARAERNLRHLPCLAADPKALGRAVRDVFYHSVLNYLDFLRDARLSDDEIWASCQVEHEDAFDALVAEGRGMVIFVAHTSAFELGAARLAVKGLQVLIPVERMQPEPLFEFFRRSRERLGMRLAPADSRETLHEITNVLRSGGVVAFGMDRLVTGASVELPFFGEPAKMPITPAGLTLRLGARVGAAFAYRTAPDKARVVFVPLAVEQGVADVGAEGGAGGAGDVRTAAQEAPRTKRAGTQEGKQEAAAQLQRQFLVELERFLIAHPGQWVSALSPIWEA